MAMYQALRERYAEVIAEAGGDHARVASCELRAFDTQHAEIGAMLAQRWRLPESLVMPVRYHERPTAPAPPGGASGVDRQPGPRRAHRGGPVAEPRRYMERCEQWFSLSRWVGGDPARIGGATRELAGLFNVDAGAAWRAAILDAARNQHIGSRGRTPQPFRLAGGTILRDGGGIDANRRVRPCGIRRVVPARLRARSKRQSVGIVVLSVDVGEAGPVAGASWSGLGGRGGDAAAALDPWARVCRISPR